MCPAGAACNLKGIDDWERYLCPTGHYCPRAGMTDDPIPCEAGTYRNETGATDKEQCWSCPAGFFCGEGAQTFTPCDAGYYCKEGSKVQKACTKGTYCPAMSEKEITCPQGYFCPNYRTTIYSKCENGTFCGEGQSAPTPCPKGQFGTGITFNYLEVDSCIPCGQGEYSDSDSNSCKPCEAGYICFQGATTSRPNSPEQNGQICDPGFYCPAGSTTGIACQVGTYSNEKGNGQRNQCKQCPRNTYGNAVALT